MSSAPGVAVDDGVDVLDAVVRLHQRAGDLHHAAAVGRVDERHRLAREDVARVDDAQRREDDPGVTVGVAAPK